MTTENGIEVSLIGVLLAVLLCSATVLCQAALVRMDFSDLWSEADVVLVGDVLNITTHQGDEGSIYRNVVVGVARYNKNPLNLSRVDVHVLGGVMGGIGSWVEDQPEFTVGETVLVFLRHHPEEHPRYQAEGYHVVGGPQGKFTVADGAATNIAGDRLELTDSLGLPAIFVASDLCIHQWGECAENVNITFIVTNVGEASGFFNASFYYEDPALEGAGAGGYNIMDVCLEAGEFWTVSASDIFVAELPGVYEVEADTELLRKDYRNPLTMNFEVLQPKKTTGSARKFPESTKNGVSLLWVLFIVVCAAALYGIRFFKTSKEPKEQGFNDQITEGDSVYVGFVDTARPDIVNRPNDGTFWSSKYTPIWLRKKREEEPEKDRRGAE